MYSESILHDTQCVRRSPVAVPGSAFAHQDLGKLLVLLHKDESTPECEVMDDGCSRHARWIAPDEEPGAVKICVMSLIS